MRFDADRLMSLLPAVYRDRDAESGELRALLTVIAEQIGVVEDDLEQLYDDQFVETCAEWVLPYIGDLLGNRPLFSGGSGADQSIAGLFPELEGPRFIPRTAMRARPDVAKTIFYRKRKATRAMLEELAADVTGWDARVVEFFELLRWTQCVRNHLRLFNQGCPDLRDADALKRLNGPFDSIPHAVDVRPINTLDGWYETRNIGFFLWRLRSLELKNINPVADSLVSSRFFANRLAIDEPLFTAGGRGETGFLNEAHAPGPIRPSFLRDDLRHTSDPSRLYGDDLSLFIETGTNPNWTPVPRNLICVSDLSAWRPPLPNMVAVDVRTGRILFDAAYTAADLKDVRISVHYGFSAELGGGCYPREGWLIKPSLLNVPEIVVTKGPTTDPQAVSTIDAAITKWKTAGRPKTIIRILDSSTYLETKPLTLDPPAGSWVAIEAADECNPHINTLTNPLTIKCGDDRAWVAISGILLESNIEIGKLAGRLRLLHTTMRLKTGPAVIEAPQSVLNDLITNKETDTFRVEAAFSILGRVIVPSDGRGLAFLDCILDGGAAPAITGTAANTPASALHIERSTVFGSVFVRELPMASESIFNDELRVARRQQGCARFCFIPYGSLTPRRYRCQPDLEIRVRADAQELEKNRRLTDPEHKAIVDAVVPLLVPAFTSRHFGDPGYAQLHLNVPRQIFIGAEDGSEMGVFCHLKQPQREKNLRSRLAEYLPFGLTPGLIYVT